MPIYYFDCRVGDRIYRDKAGAEYDDRSAATQDIRETVLELVKGDAELKTEYEVTLRQDLKPLYRLRLRQ